MADDPLITFLAARLAEAWSAARDRELAAGLAESAETRMVDALRDILTAYIKTEAAGLRGDGWIAFRFAVETLAEAWSEHPEYRQEWGTGPGPEDNGERDHA